MFVGMYVYMSSSLEMCRRRRIRIPLQHRWGDQIKWEEMNCTYGTWHMWGRREIFRGI